MTNTNPAAAPGRWTDLGLRSLSAVLLIPAVLLDVWQGGLWFILFMALLGVLMAYEWSNIVHQRNALQFALHAMAAILAAFLPQELGVMGALGCLAILTLASIFAVRGAGASPTAFSALGVAYVGLPVMALVLLRQSSEWGVHAIMWLMLVVWATDTFAYFAGRIFGGPKLAPRYSPKKTWSGLLGGMVGAALVSGIYAKFYVGAGFALLPVAAALAVVAQLGDIFESAMKRAVGVKDSGDLIPGHGGVLDRVDGLVAAALMAAIIGFARNSSNLADGLLRW